MNGDRIFSRPDLDPAAGGHTLNRLLQVPKLDGLGEVLGESRAAALFDVVGRSETRERDTLECVLGPKLPHEFQTTAIWQLDVADQELEVGLRGHAQGHAPGCWPCWTSWPRCMSICEK